MLYRILKGWVYIQAILDQLIADVPGLWPFHARNVPTL